MELEGVRHRLQAMRDDLLKIDSDSAESRKAVTLDQQSVGRLSRMDAMQVQAMAGAVNRRRMAALQRIEAALQRIEEGEFGYCITCGDEIDVRRLDIDPSTPQCADCADPTKD